jgi:predicted RNA binding protein YcfA (HicA-like mRNA interferase family)
MKGCQAKDAAVTRPVKLYASLLANPNQIITFRDFERIIRAAGFILKRQKGSHRTYRHPAVPKVLTIQPNGKDAEPYQVDTFIAIMMENGLEFDS